MLIHIVQPGDTIQSIATSYGVTVNELVRDNGITNASDLVVGQTIVIVYPSVVYTIKEGDTLEGIANQYNISLIQLLRNNPHLADSNTIYPGESLVIHYEDAKLRTITTNGFAYPFISMDILKKTLPFLTFLSIFTYTITFEGDLVDIDDLEVIRTAKQFSVVPIMIVSTLTGQGEGNFLVSHEILNNPEKKNLLIQNILNVLETKGYLGLNLS
jgi:spore germination protein